MSPRARLGQSIVLLVGIYLVGTIGYALIEDVSILDAAYMAAITLSTVGYRESIQLDDFGRMWTIGFILFGVAGSSYALTSLVSVMVSGDVRRMIGRRKLEAYVKKLNDHVVFCGYGRMGKLAITSLRSQGLKVVVIERSPEIAAELADSNIPHVIGDATEEDVLSAAGVAHAKTLIAGLPHDADNVYVTLTARGLRPDLNIIARAEQPSTVDKLHRAGASRVVSPQVVGATKITNMVTRPNVVDLMEVAADGVELEMQEHVIEPDSPLCNKSLKDAPIREAGDAIVVAINRPGDSPIYSPTPNEVIKAGDILILIGRTGVTQRLRTLTGGST